ncbi:MAG TPA: DUF2264 domain-containing protein [Candidatus Limnocylindrales bacterium]|nr:DUF2264 domain-containing protein [Candidatus Limnocylindrales bacterium]
MSTPPVSFGGSRSDWVALLARLTDGFVRSIPDGGSPARAALPGAPADDPVPAIEGFARMSVAWGAWLREPSNPGAIRWAGREHDVARLLARGLRDATDPSGPAWWGPIRDRDQRIVEAAEIATALWLGGDRLRAALEALDPKALERCLDWLAGVDGKDLWPDNWVLFPVVPALVRRAAGRPIDVAAVDRALDWMVEHTVGDGWTSDGAGHALDLYSGWAIHWHLLWWAALDGARRPRLAADIRRRARAWLRFAASLVAEDGGFPRFGRSLGYRFAIAAPFAQAALLGIDPLPPGAARLIVGRIGRHGLAEDALDPATDWFRVGVAGERPEVVEGYVSAGASAWAAHAFVSLALPATDAFWAAAVPAGDATTAPPLVAAAAAGLLAARTTAGTTLHNARTGHPADIAEHDYAATYGKLAYRSAFPFDVPVEPGASAGSDDALTTIEATDGTIQRFAHRNESRAGSAGPGWIVSRYDLPTPRRTGVRTVVVLLGPLEVRIHAVRPGAEVRLRDGGPALGMDGPDEPATVLDEAGQVVRVAGDGRVVAIRALHGFDEVGSSAAGRGRMNLVHDRSVHPWAQEGRPSDRRRLLASAVVTALAPDRGGAADAAAALRSLAIEVDGGAGARLHVGAGFGALSAMVDVSERPPSRAVVGGRGVVGTGIRVVLAADDGSAFGGERIVAIEGVLRLTRPGIVAISRVGAGVEATVAGGIAIDPAWAGAGLDRVRVREGGGPFGERIPLRSAGVAPDAFIRSQARRLGARLVTIRFERR